MDTSRWASARRYAIDISASEPMAKAAARAAPPHSMALAGNETKKGAPSSRIMNTMMF